MRGKRGAADMAIDWSLALLFILLCAALLIVIVSFFYRTGVDVTHIAPDVYVAKVYFSPHVLTYVEDDVIRFGTIDVNKFSSAQLSRNNEYIDSYNENIQTFVAARLRLYDDSGNISLPENPIYDNKKLYDRYHPFRNVGGSGGATVKTVVYPVRLSSGGEAFLEIEMVIPYD